MSVCKHGLFDPPTTLWLRYYYLILLLKEQKLRIENVQNNRATEWQNPHMTCSKANAGDSYLMLLQMPQSLLAPNLIIVAYPFNNGFSGKAFVLNNVDSPLSSNFEVTSG